MKKSTTLWIKAPYLITASPYVIERLEKSTPPNSKPTIGMIKSATREETIFPKAPPMTTPTAKSNTFPFNAIFKFRPHGCTPFTKLMTKQNPCEICFSYRTIYLK